MDARQKNVRTICRFVLIAPSTAWLRCRHRPLAIEVATAMTYDPALSDADAAPSYARALQACVGSLQALARPTATVFYRIDASGEPVDFELFGMTAAMHRAYVSRYRPLDPLHPSRCASQPGAVVTLASQLPDERRDTSSYWTGFLRRHGVVDVVEVLLRDGGAVLAAFSLLRLAGDGRYSAPEIAALRAVQPVVEAALLPPLRAVRGIRRIACDVRLTHREEQIARLVRDGRSNKAIARDLALGQPTVKTHLLRMFRKLGVSNRTELVGALFL
ncbi:response regulator transcription factor [Burkholderia pseudomallei]|uniref:response regulator transcription factor n=1 Tax=Burkholderia pseudomallei TaxID=28450 RepID=UPI00050E746E|nr:LuxR C-terminal-related transcriptional regulator [Burkholderia pseudomallei]KGD22577.1 bacterial regulatory s, luxR family protein [Burkholderia pseudomallei]ONB53797.1 helix-turn-helix transcriptional regulator [Burkholderia pseudomallei]ONB95081.1 helix-turn-helix transcriptional regulator [Burkholderia pseudomallei]